MKELKCSCFFILIGCLSFLEGTPTSKKEEPQVTINYYSIYNKVGQPMKEENIFKTSVNILRPIIFLINGLNKANNTEVKELLDEYLEKLLYNVFIVEWNDAILDGNVDKQHKDEARTKNNQQFVNNAVAKKIASFVTALYDKTGEIVLDIHFVGINSGFRISNLAAKIIESKDTKWRRIKRITGLLSPLGKINQKDGNSTSPPSHETVGKEDEASKKLYEINANFVDVVHSIGDLNLFENPQQMGHVDFYIHNEKCDGSKDTSCGSLDAIKIFTKSINTSKFKAVKCLNKKDTTQHKCENQNDDIVFGENVNKNATGIYFLEFSTE